MANTKVQTKDTEVAVDFGDIEVPAAEVKPPMTERELRLQLAQIKWAQGTRQAWGPRAIARLKAAASEAGFKVTGL